MIFWKSKREEIVNESRYCKGCGTKHDTIIPFNIGGYSFTDDKYCCEACQTLHMMPGDYGRAYRLLVDKHFGEYNYRHYASEEFDNKLRILYDKYLSFCKKEKKKEEIKNNKFLKDFGLL